MSKNAHEIIEKIKADYKEAYGERWGQAAADLLSVRYKSGWFYITDSPLSTPYRAKEMRYFTEKLWKQVKKEASR